LSIISRFFFFINKRNGPARVLRRVSIVRTSAFAFRTPSPVHLLGAHQIIYCNNRPTREYGRRTIIIISERNRRVTNNVPAVRQETRLRRQLTKRAKIRYDGTYRYRIVEKRSSKPIAYERFRISRIFRFVRPFSHQSIDKQRRSNTHSRRLQRGHGRVATVTRWFLRTFPRVTCCRRNCRRKLYCIRTYLYARVRTWKR